MGTGILHPYVTTGYLTAVVTLSIGFFVYTKNKASAIHKSFLYLSLAIFQWSFFTAFQSMQTDAQKALFWGRFCHIGVMFIPVFFYDFSLKITGGMDRKYIKWGKITAVIAAPAIMFTPLFIPTERTDTGPNFLVSAGPLYILIVLFFSAYILKSLICLYREANHSSGVRRKHLLYFFWSSIFGYGTGTVNFFPVYGILFPPFPYTAACGAIYFAIIAYAIVRHRLFDIELLVKRGSVFAGLFLSVYVIVSLVIYLLSYVITGPSSPVLSALSIVLAMLLYEPLKRLLERLTQKFLYQKKRSYTSLMQFLTARLAGIRNPRELSEFLVDFLTHQMGLEWAALYLRVDEKNADLRLISEQGREQLKELRNASGIEPLFEGNWTPILLSPFDLEPDLDTEAKAALRSERIEAVAPIVVEGRLFGLILAGKKTSDADWNREDEVLLQTLMDQSSMLYLSDKLLKSIYQSNLELGQRMKMSALTQLARGVHHEVRNPLHAISLYASTTLEDLKRRDPQSLKSPILDRTTAMLEAIDRIQRMLTRFSQFARPREETALKYLELRTEVERFFHLMKEGHTLDGIEVWNRIPPGLSVWANTSTLQEILFNLFNNAREAMYGKGRLEIHARENHGHAECTIRDTGPGIPEYALKRIFDDYYTTKTGTESVGIGLAIVRQRCQEMGASVEASNHPQGGAVITLRMKSELAERSAA
ncbi:ATP-binding protein [Omnitrophica bacterium]|nr:ATP-binding protein [Candidatus Omnitrophota bacterium]